MTNVSVEDAAKYCTWLGERDPAHTYRLPTEEEWELAAGHMPKDADFNCGAGDSIRPVDAFAQTKGTSGGIDFWGNCWEWTATKRVDGKNTVKGGAFDAKRTDCRTEAKAASRGGARGYPNVTIRLVRETKCRDRALERPIACGGTRGGRRDGSGAEGASRRRDVQGSERGRRGPTSTFQQHRRFRRFRGSAPQDALRQ